MAPTYAVPGLFKIFSEWTRVLYFVYCFFRAFVDGILVPWLKLLERLTSFCTLPS